MSLLGSPETLAFSQTEDGLVVTMPSQKPCDHAYALKIEGLDLAASQPQPPLPAAVHAAADGTLTLKPDTAILRGKLQAQGGATPNIGYWNDAQDTVSWNVHFDAPGTYAITSQVSAASGDTSFVVDAGAGTSTPLAVLKTASWDDYQNRHRQRP